MDLLVSGGTIVTCDGGNRVFEGDLLVREGRIAALGDAAKRAALRPARVLDAHGCAVIPGLVQAHVHLCQVLFRGMADDLPLLDWLRKRIWPLEAAHDEKSARASAELGLLEAMRAGTTTILDMGTVRAHDADHGRVRALGHPRDQRQDDDGRRRRRAARACARRRARASTRAIACCRDWDGHAGGRIRYAYAPRFILSCSEQLVRGAAERAKDARRASSTRTSPSTRASAPRFARRSAATTSRSCARGA